MDGGKITLTVNMLLVVLIVKEDISYHFVCEKCNCKDASKPCQTFNGYFYCGATIL